MVFTMRLEVARAQVVDCFVINRDRKPSVLAEIISDRLRRSPEDAPRSQRFNNAGMQRGGWHLSIFNSGAYRDCCHNWALVISFLLFFFVVVVFVALAVCK
jgi:hypothetical protein